MNSRRIIEKLLSESTDYRARGSKIQFSELVGMSDDGVSFVRVDRGTASEIKHGDRFAAGVSYALTDSTNYLFLTFTDEQRLESATRYGANDVEELLNALDVDWVSEEDDEYFDDVDDDE